MANPPITIGPFDNVPAPGSPVRSDWSQEISQYVTDLGAAQTMSSYVPAGNYDFYSTSWGDWLTGIPQVTKPVWAARVNTITTMAGFFEPQGWGSQDMYFRLRYGVGLGGAVHLGQTNYNVRHQFTLIDAWNAIPGAQTVAIQALRPGGGTVRADNSCRVSICWMWQH